MVSPVNSGTFSYNGVTWASMYKSKVDMKPVKDSAGRALVVREYTLDVEGYVAAAPGGSTDTTLVQMRRLLQVPGGALRFFDKGYGDIKVNLPGGLTWDAAYGPWPEILSWDPVGNDQGCLVRWRCKTLIPCEENPTPRGVIEMCWSQAWDIDDDGYTKRAIDGHITVEATRQTVSSRAIPDNADAYRDKVVPNLPPGFRRTQHYELSEDKRTLKFHVEDQQLPQPLPAGCTKADVHQRVTWELKPHSGTPLTETLSGTLSIPAATSKGQLWDLIVLIIKSRVLTRDKAPLLPVGQGRGQARKAQYLLSRVEIDDDVFGRGSAFSVSYMILGAQLNDFLAVSQLWQPIPGTSFTSWRTSLFAPAGAGKAYAPRGMAGMTFQNSDDAIVDLCGRQTVLKGGLLRNPGTLRGRLANATEPANAIDPDRSWLQYRLRLRLLEDDRVIRHRTLRGSKGTTPVNPLDGFVTTLSTSPGLKPPKPGEIGGFLNPKSGPEQTAVLTAGATSKTPEVLQRVSAPALTVRLEGFAVRAAYPIPTPRVASIGGVAVTQTGQDVAQEQVASIGGVPIYASSFRVDYALPQDPQGVMPMPVNPALE